MTALINATLFRLYQVFLPWVQFAYRQPLLSGIFLSIASSIYLIFDYAIVNRSALSLLWQLSHHPSDAKGAFAWLIHQLAPLFNQHIVTAGHCLMIICHAVLMALLLLIAKQLFFSKATRWALILLLLAHPSYNDFRAYIIVEPVFWCLWLSAVYFLLVNYRQRTIATIIVWLLLFLLATLFSVTAWFWLLLFPFGALFWRPWQRKSVAYALLGYALIVSLLLVLPVYQGISPIHWLITTVVKNPHSLIDVLDLNQSNWVKEENSLMASIFVFSGATSLVVIRTLLAFGVACVGLAIYALMRKQYTIIDYDRRRILVYVAIFDWFISVLLFVLDNDSGSIISFSASLLLFLLSALGLSYVFKKIALARYSRLSVLVIVWCIVAYVASGFIIFGPRKDYVREAGEFTQNIADSPVYSNDQFFLFYANKNPSETIGIERLTSDNRATPFYYAYEKNRNRDLPQLLSNLVPMATFSNQRGDKLLIYKF